MRAPPAATFNRRRRRKIPLSLSLASTSTAHTCSKIRPLTLYHYLSLATSDLHDDRTDAQCDCGIAAEEVEESQTLNDDELLTSSSASSSDLGVDASDFGDADADEDEDEDEDDEDDEGVDGSAANHCGASDLCALIVAAMSLITVRMLSTGKSV